MKVVGEMVQLVMCLPQKHEVPSTHIKTEWQRVFVTFNTAGHRQVDRSLELTGQQAYLNA